MRDFEMTVAYVSLLSAGMGLGVLLAHMTLDRLDRAYRTVSVLARTADDDVDTLRREDAPLGDSLHRVSA